MIFLIRRFLDSCFFLILIAGFILFTGQPCPASTPIPAASAEDFPVYRVIRPNVDFWIDIFTKYSRADGVIHDARDLSLIYGTVKLNPANTRKAAEQNRKVKETALKKHKAALLNLAKGESPGNSLEKQLAAQFDRDPKPGRFKQAAHNLRIQTGLKQQFKEGIIRSGALVDEFKRIFNAHGLPEDLVYLPCVESSFNTAAYSKFGAAGIWQFTRSTGELYMDIGYVVDQRRDPFIATHGAARLLKKNFGELQAWPLAITAYNHGLAGMKRAKKKHGSYPRIYTLYQSRSFKFASRNFYSEFLAAREVAKNYNRYFGNITLDRPVRHSRFKMNGYVPAQDLARGLGIDLATLKQLNPALRNPVFDGRKYIPKGYELRLPKGFSPDIIAKTAAPLYRTGQKPSKFHRVQKGDTAGSIAGTHKVPLRDLILANGLGRRATIYIGQTLRIPVPEETAGLKTALAKTSPLHPKPVPLEPAPPEPVPPEPVPPEPVPPEPVLPEPVLPEPVLPKAKPDPSPSVKLAAQPVQTDAAVNLKIVTSDLKIQKVVQNKQHRTGIIHVAPEETLGHYADWLGIATQNIRNLNRLTYGRSISIGQAIKIPLPETGLAGFEEQRYEFHQEILEDFFDSFFVAGTRNYEIKSGDTIWDLCENELEIPLWLLEKYNPAMDFTRLHPGQRLVYPQVFPNGVKS